MVEGKFNKGCVQDSVNHSTSNTSFNFTKTVPTSKDCYLYFTYEKGAYNLFNITGLLGFRTESQTLVCGFKAHVLHCLLHSIHQVKHLVWIFRMTCQNAIQASIYFYGLFEHVYFSYAYFSKTFQYEHLLKVPVFSKELLLRLPGVNLLTTWKNNDIAHRLPLVSPNLLTSTLGKASRCQPPAWPSALLADKLLKFPVHRDPVVQY